MTTTADYVKMRIVVIITTIVMIIAIVRIRDVHTVAKHRKTARALLRAVAKIALYATVAVRV